MTDKEEEVREQRASSEEMDHRELLVLLSLCSSGLWAAQTNSESDPVPVRLVGGTSRCVGGLEVYKNKEWRPANVFGWNQMLTTKVCKQLDCGSAVSTKDTYLRSARPVWDINSSCVQSTSTLSDCVGMNHGFWLLEVNCSDSVRLLSGTNHCSGRLEVKTNQSWSSVCEGDFEQQDAEVVCRELSCGAPSGLQGALYGDAEAPVWSREFRCKGNESHLLDCGWSDSAPNTCSPDKAVGLTCSDPLNIRLVGETSRCAGEVELKINNEWRLLEADSASDRTQADHFCNLLDCGSAVSSNVTRQYSNRPVWDLYTNCLHPTSTLRDCVGKERPVRTSRGFEVICSDLLTQPNVSVSTYFDGFFEQFHVFWGFSFTITCSAEPQYQGGSFQLFLTTSDTAQNYTMPAVNHSARFLFPTADNGHQGNYTCVYHVRVFSHNFTSESQPLHITVSGFFRDQIIRYVVVLSAFVVCNTLIYLYYKRRGERIQREEDLVLRVVEA